MAGKTDKKLAEAIGTRIDAAARRAGLRTTKLLEHATGLHDRTLRRYIKGDHVPDTVQLMVIAEACNVSIDWLVHGREEIPLGYYRWLETVIGQGSEDEARRFLMSLPLGGWRAGVVFYDAAYRRWEAGATPENAVEVGIATELETK